MGTLAHYRQRVVTNTDVVFIRKLIAEHPRASRRELSYLLCAAWNWVQPNGALCDMVCRGLMLKLHREGRIELPPVRRRPPNPLVERKNPTAVEVDTRPLRDRLAKIRPLEFRSVRRTPEEPLFNSLLEQYHYLRYKQPVEIPHLASHLLARMTRMLSGEWERAYGHPIYFVETFIDPERYRGTCYRAANWMVLGRTTGRGKNAWSKRPNRPIKEVLGYPLTPHFRQLLAEV